MAEVVGTASAIATFVTLALQSSIVLYQTVQSLQSRDKAIRELRQELEALQGVLQALKESTGNLDVDLASLEQPLKRCNNACDDFNTLIKRCTSHSTEDRSSKRDWVKLRYMGEDIPVSRTCWRDINQPFQLRWHMQTCKCFCFIPCRLSSGWPNMI